PLVRNGGQLSMDPAQGRMPFAMPEAVCVPDAPRRLLRRRAGVPNARGSTWRVFCRLLLGTDGGVSWGARDGHSFDCPSRVTHSSGKGRSLRTPDSSPCWRSPHRGRCVVVLNGNVLRESRTMWP